MNIDQQPLISIIMPAFYSEKTIEQSIHSVIEQTYQNWELLVVEDGSSDSVESIIEKLSNPRISFRRNFTNMGVSKTRNLAIELVKIGRAHV